MMALGGPEFLSWGTVWSQAEVSAVVVSQDSRGFMIGHKLGLLCRSQEVGLDAGQGGGLLWAGRVDSERRVYPGSCLWGEGGSLSSLPGIAGQDQEHTFVHTGGLWGIFLGRHVLGRGSSYLGHLGLGPCPGPPQLPGLSSLRLSHG